MGLIMYNTTLLLLAIVVVVALLYTQRKSFRFILHICLILCAFAMVISLVKNSDAYKNAAIENDIDIKAHAKIDNMQPVVNKRIEEYLDASHIEILLHDDVTYSNHLYTYTVYHKGKEYKVQFNDEIDIVKFVEVPK